MLETFYPLFFLKRVETSFKIGMGVFFKVLIFKIKLLIINFILDTS